MSDDDMIRRGDALKALDWGDIYGRNAQDAIAALPAVKVGVKPLVWEPSEFGKPWHSAKSPWGWYYAQWDDETQAWFASLEMGEVEAPIILSPSDVPSIAAAKAAAQADYEARILAALDMQPAPDAQAVRELLAMLPGILDEAESDSLAAENEFAVGKDAHAEYEKQRAAIKRARDLLALISKEGA